MASYFVVQSFSNGASGLSPDSPIQAQNLHQARRLAERLSLKKSMVIAFMRDGNPKTGDYGDPKLIFAKGDELPEEVAEMERV